MKKLQLELLGIIFLILAPASAEEEKDMKDRALKIIDELKDHINDCIEISNRRMTILDCIISCDSQDNVRLNNRSLLDLEDAVKSIGGQTLQNLEQVDGTSSEVIQHSSHEAMLAIIEQGINANFRIMQYCAALATFILGTSITHSIRLDRQVPLGETGAAIFRATLGGLLSVPMWVIPMGIMTPIIESVSECRPRHIMQSIVECSTANTSSALGLFAALNVGITAFRSIVGTNMEFGESLRSGLMTKTATTIGICAGAALSTALIRRAFAPISTNLESVATEQPNIQEQSI
ncbi:hypothetical protein HGO53_00400 [Wolbachia endosymbiont of Diaphorina citri]|nr:hypothetical protein HGO48_00400 [Wolbachia endosymbiont of Diaphorina citri]QJT96302.1 hypothetical protein HGO49_00400 [Wolbachia endosymbiont of Diaphorina citri]QJT97552.1 hypothetical protein HGO53_00400 [Wolbachia endosymbiont of Diaphorina citri]QLK12036.1 hypothetical protein FK497_00400 [Wolbachia endosymbiont of Diaphorina citri]QXY87583.1 hypothetical protein GZ064_00445 [Wolbachia endosymbiont of Diaphorina citri]